MLMPTYTPTMTKKRGIWLVTICLLIFPAPGCDDGQVRFDKRSEFQRILVVDEGDKRYLRFGKADSGNQSTMSISDPQAVAVEYIRFSLLGMLMIPRRERVLMIGLGGGTFTTLLRRHYPDLWIDAVEIDPVVVEAARRFFGVQEDNRFRIHVGDGAKFIRKTPHEYDLIFLDAYSGEGLPPELVSPVFFAAVKDKLAEQGVVIINLWDQGLREGFLAGRFREVFPYTACIRSTDGYNLVLFGKETAMPAATRLVEAARRFTSEADLSFDLAEVADGLNMQCPPRGINSMETRVGMR